MTYLQYIHFTRIISIHIFGNNTLPRTKIIIGLKYGDILNNRLNFNGDKNPNNTQPV